MSLQVTCGCGKQYKVSDDNAGKKAICKRCGRKLSIPSAEEVTSSDSLFDALEADAVTSGNLLPSSYPRSNSGQSDGNVTIIASTVAGTAVVMLVMVIGVYSLLKATPAPTTPVANGRVIRPLCVRHRGRTRS